MIFVSYTILAATYRGSEERSSTLGVDAGYNGIEWGVHAGTMAKESNEGSSIADKIAHYNFAYAIIQFQ